MTGKPHIGCASHMLALEVRYIIDCHPDLKNYIGAVHYSMKGARTKSKSADVLHNITDLQPVIDNDPKWSGKVQMLRRFTSIREDMIESSHHVDANFVVNQKASKTCRNLDMLNEFPHPLGRGTA